MGRQDEKRVGVRRERVLLDTSFCIELLKGKKKAVEYMEKDSRQPVISSITIFELMLRKTNLELVENFISRAESLDFDEVAAKEASKIYKEFSLKGLSLANNDLFISAIARSNGCALLTLDKKGFQKVQGLFVDEI